MRQLHEKVSAMNKSYYDLRGKIVSAERRIKVLDEHLSMWEQYEKHKGIRRQLDKVKQGKKGQFEQKHGTELALYEAAARYLEKLKSGGEAVTPKKWRAESEKLTAQKEIHYQEMRTMREQIKAVENLRKAADQLERSQQDRNRKKEDNQILGIFFCISISIFISHSGPCLHHKKRRIGKHPIRRRAKIIFRTDRCASRSGTGSAPEHHRQCGR